MSHFRDASNFFKNFRENNSQALVISKKTQVPRTDFTASLRMLF